MKIKDVRIKMARRTEMRKREESGDVPYHLIFGMSLAVVLLFAGICVVSATDYYVKVGGNNGLDGTSPKVAWATPSYATQQAQAGDTIYLLSGTWYDEEVVFANSGNVTHPITVTAYNGTPILDGVDKTGTGIKIDDKSYITISNIVIHDYNVGIDGENIIRNLIIDNVTIYDIADDGMQFHRASLQDSVLKNFTIYNTTGEGLTRTDYTNAADCHNVTISNFTIHDTADDALCWRKSSYIYIRNGTVYNSGSDGIHFELSINNSIIENCWVNNTVFHGIAIHDYTIGNYPCYNNTIRDTHVGYARHNCIDLHSGAYDTIVENCTLTGTSDAGQLIYFHNLGSEMIVRDCTLYGDPDDMPDGIDGGPIDDNYLGDILIENNIIYNVTTGISFNGLTENITIRNNTLYDITETSAIDISGDNVTMEKNNIGDKTYRLNRGSGTLRDPIGDSCTARHSYGGGDLTVEYTDGRIFTRKVTYDNTGTISEPTWAATGSNFALESDLGTYGCIAKATTFNMTAVPSSDLVSITVNKFDTSLPQGEHLVIFTADTTDGNRVIFTVWDLKQNCFYLIKKDGVEVSTEQADSSGYIQFNNSQWSAHIFTIEESATPSDTGTISGLVTNTTGATILGATVTVEGTGKSGATDANGIYTLTDVHINSYNVTCTAPDYQDAYHSNIEVSEGVTTTVNFALISSTITPISDLVGKWLFDEGTEGIAVDSSGNGNNGTINSGSWTSGKVGTALDFNGLDDYISIPNSPTLNPAEEITLSAWVNPGVIPQDGWNKIIAKPYTNYSSPWQQYALTLHDNHFVFELNTEGTKNVITSTETLEPNTWYHVVGTYDGSEMRIYVNAALKGTLPKSGAIAAYQTNVHIGAGIYSDAETEYFNGTIDELKIYNRALTTEEIQADYKAGLNGAANTLSGTVTSPCGTDIANATVTLTTRSGAEINTTQTDSTGHYAFANVTPDYYDITATKRSYWSNTNNVTVTAEAPETADIVLCQKGDFNTNSEPADAGDLAMMADATAAGTSDVTYDLDGDGNPADEADLTLLKNVSVGVAVLE